MEQENKGYEESKEASSFAGWLMLIGICILLFAWGFWIFFTVKDTPRKWDFGILPDTPAESIYSTEKTPTTTTPPRQLPELPEAVPLRKSEGR
jgi:hypothetical protein